MICRLPFSECDHKIYSKDRMVFTCNCNGSICGNEEKVIKDSKLIKLKDKGQTELI